jgi:hypothetical protein
MADWSTLRGFVMANYKVEKDLGDDIRLLFDVGEGRSQLVIVSKIADTGWAEVSTAVCREDHLDARDALRRNNKMKIGGLAMLEDGTIIFRHAFPLENLDANEFQEPLHTAAMFGDSLERELAGADTF